MARQPAEKWVTWEELFFDLAFVFALTQFSHLLHEEHTWAGLGKVLILFVIVYWLWGGVVLYTDQQNVGVAPGRVVILSLGFDSLVLSMTIPEAYGERGLSFVCAALSGRILLGLVTLRKRPLWRSFVLGPHGVVLAIAPLLVTGALLDGTPRIVLWAVAAAIDVFSPWLARGTVRKVRVQPRHYTHRYGLLIMLVIGESVIRLGATAVQEPLTNIRLISLAAAYGLVCALWWVYFGYGVRTFRWALEHAEDQSSVRRAVLVYGHVPFSLGIIAVADGLGDVVASPLDSLEIGVAGFLFAGSALFLVTCVYTDWRIYRKIVWQRLGASALCLALLPLTPVLPALVALALLAGVVAGLGVLEERIRHHRAGGSENDPQEPGPTTGATVDRDDDLDLDQGPVQAE
ncbi:low temperature requirement protein A [Micromonospora sp. NPDC050417]|uniref:low temperature requirement protein A n=1 Tax=Micromonospora sp. NPDC050417 TaxID=3364280 RepID=UPI0037A5BC32